MKLKKNGKNIFRKFFILPAGFALLLFVFFASGCTGKNVLDKAQVKKIVSQNKKEQSVRISYSWWGNDNRTVYTLKGIELFHSLNPNINVFPHSDLWAGYEDKFEKAFNEGTNSDVMQINFDWLFKYSPDGNGFYDLNTLCEYIDFYNFTSSDLEYGTINGKLNAIPIAFNSVIPVYNKTVLDEHHLKVPSTWDELFYAAKVLKKDGMSVLGMGEKHFFLLCIAWFEQYFSKRLFLDNKTINASAEELEYMFVFASRLIKENVVYPVIRGFEAADLKNGKLNGVFAWCNESSKFATYIELIEGHPVLGSFITIPSATESGWYIKPVSMYAIKKDCKHPAEAAMFVNFLLNNQEFALMQQNEKGVPLSNKSLTALMEHGKLESMQYSSLMKIRFNSGIINQMVPIMENKDVNKVFLDNVTDFIDGKKTSAEAAKYFENYLKERM
ncbi:MAG: ABC transporter substrate-binding protein [Treponema sp.]|nr:ABC transporter substrate-binding protein [Treponema sp.]